MEIHRTQAMAEEPTRHIESCLIQHFHKNSKLKSKLITTTINTRRTLAMIKGLVTANNEEAVTKTTDNMSSQQEAGQLNLRVAEAGEASSLTREEAVDKPKINTMNMKSSRTPTYIRLHLSQVRVEAAAAEEEDPLSINNNTRKNSIPPPRGEEIQIKPAEESPLIITSSTNKLISPD
jgi:hypothetical protein